MILIFVSQCLHFLPIFRLLSNLDLILHLVFQLFYRFVVNLFEFTNLLNQFLFLTIYLIYLKLGPDSIKQLRDLLPLILLL